MQLSDFEILTTADGSPSLKPSDSEAMHSSKGAFSETLYIYGHGIHQAFQKCKPLSVLSVGLGLGYNELLWASYCVANNVSKSYLHSFESIPFLSNSFSSWVNDKDCDLESTYNQMLSLFACEFKIQKSAIKAFLKKQLGVSFFIHSSLTSENRTSKQFNCIFYDAYSSATSPELWEPNFLNNFIANYSDSDCILTTYAATSNFTKSLIGQGFQTHKRKGFAFKRESTFAIKSLKLN